MALEIDGRDDGVRALRQFSGLTKFPKACRAIAKVIQARAAASYLKRLPCWNHWSTPWTTPYPCVAGRGGHKYYDRPLSVRDAGTDAPQPQPTCAITGDGRMSRT